MTNNRENRLKGDTTEQTTNDHIVGPVGPRHPRPDVSWSLSEHDGKQSTPTEKNH